MKVPNMFSRKPRDQDQSADEKAMDKDMSRPASTSSSDKDQASGEEKNQKDQSHRPGSTSSSGKEKGDGDEKEGEDESQYPGGVKVVLISIALCLSVFCMALDNTIIATAIPRITDEFNSVGDVGWYGSAYLLTVAALQLFFGRLYSFYNVKWVYLIAIGIFELGSLICGVAPDSAALIIGRALAGVGASGIFAGALIIVAHTVPLRKRPIYTGFIGSMYGIASVAGPLMGGAFTDHVTWRWCFYINLPLGGVTVFFIVLFFTSPAKSERADLPQREKLGQLDFIGTAIFIPAIVCLLLALQWGGSTYEWSNWRIILLFVLFGILIIAFIFVQGWRKEKATVPPRIFKNRTVWTAAWCAAFLGASFFALVYYLPIWFQAIKSVSATKSGIDNLPMLLGVTVFSIISGVAVTVLGPYKPFLIASAVLMSIGAGLLTTFTPTTNHEEWIGFQIIFGAGVGLGMQQTLIAVQTVLSIDDIPVGTAIVMFALNIGGALFLSIAQNVFSNQLIKNVATYVRNVDPIAIIQAGATNIKNQKGISAQDFHSILVAYNKTLTQTFYVSVAAAALTIVGAVLIEWKSVKGKKVQHGAA